MSTRLIVIWSIVIYTSTISLSLNCHHKCTCNRPHLVNCSYAQFDQIISSVPLNISSLTHLFIPSLITDGTDELTLNGNHFEQLNSSSFISVTDCNSITKLDLSSNRLVFIGPRAFTCLINLRHLDLSRNQLHTLNRSVFVDLSNLQTLLLDNNPLASFPDKTFIFLRSLQFMFVIYIKHITVIYSRSIHSLQLSCDCQLVDFRRWTLRRPGRAPIHISNDTICIFPIAYRGRLLDEMRPKLMKQMCGNGRLNASMVTIDPPSRALVVYPGESRQLTCRLTHVVDRNAVHIEWLHNNIPIDNNIPITIDFIDNTYSVHVQLDNLSDNNVGDWTCYVENEFGALRSSIRLITIAVDQNCIEEWTADEKGEFVWPVTDRLSTIQLACPTRNTDDDHAVATRECDGAGRWHRVNSSKCAFASDRMRQLWTIASGQLADNQTDDGQLRSLVIGVELTPFEVRLVSWIIGNRSIFDNPIVQLDIISSLATSRYVTSDYESLSLLRHRIGTIQLPTIIKLISRTQLTVCDETGISTSLLIENVTDNNDGGVIFAQIHGQRLPIVYCSHYQSMRSFGFTGTTSIRIPDSIVHRSMMATYRFVWLANIRLFETDYSCDQLWIATNDVIGVYRSGNILTDDINNRTAMDDGDDQHRSIILTFQLTVQTESLALARWNDEWRCWSLIANNTCRALIIGSSSVYFTCSSAILSLSSSSPTFFTVIQQAIEIESNQYRLHIDVPHWMYASAGFLSVSVLVVILLHCFNIGSTPSMSTKLRHCVVNECICIGMLCFGFTFGIDKIHRYMICMTTAVLGHYFTLSSLLWLTLAIRTVQRKHHKWTNPQRRLNDDSRIAVAKHAPIFGLYFLAYGLPLCACAFSLALDINAYISSRTNFCFLRIEPSGIFHMWLLLPSTIILLTAIMFLLFAAVCHRPSSSMVPPPPTLSGMNTSTSGVTADNSTSPLIISSRDDDQLSAQTSIVDNELSARFHLSTCAAALILYVFGWLNAALYLIVSNWTREYRLWSLVHSILYSIAIVLLALLLLVAHISIRLRLHWLKTNRHHRTMPLVVSDTFELLLDGSGRSNNGSIVVNQMQRLSNQDYSAENMYSSVRTASDDDRVSSLRRVQLQTANRYYRRLRKMTAINNAAATTVVHLSDVQTSTIMEENELVDIDTSPVAAGGNRRRLTDTISPIPDERHHEYYNVDSDKDRGRRRPAPVQYETNI